MSTSPSFKEDHISQIPALQLLVNLGYIYLTPKEALQERKGKKSNVLLENILEKQLQKINKINYKGSTYKFSNENISHAIKALKNIPFDGLVRTNEQIYDLLSLGKSFEETIQGNTKSYTLSYINWEDIGKNIFHVTEEFEVECSDGRRNRRPDIILFINGIPFAVIECKRPDKPDSLKEAISQNIRNQKLEEIPELFIYTQLLLAINKNEGKYGTTSTSEKYWTKWREKKFSNSNIEKIINKPLKSEIKDKLFSTRFRYVRKYFDDLEKSNRLLTEQDKTIYSLCKPERLLKISKLFIVFQAGYKIIGRYQQYFAVKNIISRVKQFKDANKRKGGVVWHTQGSGKSILMVFLAKSLALDEEIENPRVVVVTDRINLDKQIWNTFKHCGKEPEKAKSGKHLLKILQDERYSVITCVVNKFNSAVAVPSFEKVSDSNIFVLIDEGHRTQYGTLNAMMRRVLPNASYIGFTGTPLMNKEKSTAEKFGGFIDIYTIDEAVKDKVVVPLLYEGRHALKEINKKSIDKWFERVTKSLTKDQIIDLKKKFSRIEKLNAADQVLYMIAFDVSEHYSQNWKNTGFKAQLATSSKITAIKFKNFLDDLGKVTSEVIISPPDTREGHEDIYDEISDEVQKFWKKMMERFGDEERYNEELIDLFNNSDKPELLIVVDKLLTGFDSPRNTILYIFKSMKEHTLLQAIARVNRIYEGKDFGYIIDYFGLLGELDKALTTYTAFKDYDEGDLKGTLTNIMEELRKLPQYYSELWDIFKETKNKYDEEAYEQLLFDIVLRKKFYEKLSMYSRTLAIALSTTKFYEDYSDSQIKKYKDDLKFFQKLRVSVKRRYAEVVDFKEYESKIQKLLDQYISSDEVIKITELVNIFDKEKLEVELAKVKTTSSKADLIAHRTMRTIKEKFDEDPIFYEKFSKLLQKTIDDYRNKRILEAEYFGRVTEIMERVRKARDESIPSILIDKNVARAFYGVVLTVLKKTGEESEELKSLSAKIGIAIDEIIMKNAIVDWQRKEDVQNIMKNEIEDYLLDKQDLNISYDEIDLILEQILKISRIRHAK